MAEEEQPKLLVDLLRALMKMGAHPCPQCGEQIIPHLGEITLSQGHKVPAAIWLCHGHSFHWRMERPIKLGDKP